MWLKKGNIILILVFQALLCRGQSNIDSLEKTLKNASLSDSERVTILIKLGGNYENIDTSKSLKYCFAAIELAKKIGSPKLRANTIGNLGLFYYRTRNYKKAIDYFLISQKELDKVNDIALYKTKYSTYNYLGIAYFQLGVYSLSLKNYFEATNICENYLKSRNIEDCYGNIANVYLMQKKYAITKKYLIKCLEIDLSQRDTLNIAIDYLSIGNLFLFQENHDSSLHYFLKSATLKQILRDSVELSGVYINIGNSYLQLSKPSFALQYIQDALEINKKFQDPIIEAEAYLILGKIKKRIGNFSESIKHYLTSLGIAEKYYLTDIRKDNYEELSSVYLNLGDYKNAFHTYKKFSELDDSLLNLENTKQMNELEVVYETAKKEKENLSLLKENKIHLLELKQQQSIKVLLFYVLFFISFSSVIFFLMYLKEKRINYKLNTQIENYQTSVEQINQSFQKYHYLDIVGETKKSVTENSIQLVRSYLKTSLDLIEKSQKSKQTLKIKRIKDDIKKHVDIILNSITNDQHEQTKSLRAEIEFILAKLKEPHNPSYFLYKKIVLLAIINIFPRIIVLIFIFYLGWGVMDKWAYIVEALLIIIDTIFLKGNFKKSE